MVLPGKVLALGALCVVAVALVGMVVGFGHPAPGWTPPGGAPAPAPVAGAVMPAVAYRDMDGKARGPNRGYTSDLATLVGHAPDLFADQPFDAGLRAAAVARRTSRRAYNGAPPVIPHPVDANEVASCYQCHGEGRVIGPLIAPKISHQRYTNCTQCHAPVAVGAPGAVAGFEVRNEFVGAPSAGRGQRAYVGAPPTIPHTTHMREDCASCHGRISLPGLRTSHPWRVNCTQCHVPSAALDQARFDEPSPPPWAGEAQGK